MATGVTVAPNERVCVDFPRWGESLRTGFDAVLNAFKQQLKGDRDLKTAKRANYIIAGTCLLLAGGGFSAVAELAVEPLAPGFASGNGRIEATEVDVATKQPGRVEAVRVNEGDMVEAGQVLAQMEAAMLRAQLHEAEAGKRRAEEERNVTVAVAKQRENEYALGKKDLDRSLQLAKNKVIEPQQLDTDRDERTNRASGLGSGKGAGRRRRGGHRTGRGKDRGGQSGPRRYGPQKSVRRAS